VPHRSILPAAQHPQPPQVVVAAISNTINVMLMNSLPLPKRNPAMAAVATASVVTGPL
jgi:hypothetical protein